MAGSFHVWNVVFAGIIIISQVRALRLSRGSADKALLALSHQASVPPPQPSQVGQNQTLPESPPQFPPPPPRSTRTLSSEVQFPEPPQQLLPEHQPSFQGMQMGSDHGQPKTFKYGLLLEDSEDIVSVLFPEGVLVSFEGVSDSHLSQGPGMTHQQTTEHGGTPTTITDLARQRFGWYRHYVSSTINQVLYTDDGDNENRKDMRFLRSTFLPALQGKLKNKLEEDTQVASHIEDTQGLALVVSLMIFDSEVQVFQQTIIVTILETLAEFGLRERTRLPDSEGTTGSDFPLAETGTSAFVLPFAETGEPDFDVGSYVPFDETVALASFAEPNAKEAAPFVETVAPASFAEPNAKETSQSSGPTEAQLAQVPNNTRTLTVAQVNEVVSQMVNQIVHQAVEEYGLVEEEYGKGKHVSYLPSTGTGAASIDLEPSAKEASQSSRPLEAEFPLILTEDNGNIDD